MDTEEYLKGNEIEFKLFEHPAVFTCEEADSQRIYSEIRGIHSKNLFLKEKKSRRYYLYIIPADKRADLDNIGKITGDKIKFASEEDLEKILGLTKGSVSPFGLINDSENKTQVLVDKQVWDSDFVSFHPNRNTTTLELKGKDFQKYIKTVGNQWKTVE
mgnify:CR=1 FL=1|jgi:Ala-tRNA(Pro) deacylase